MDSFSRTSEQLAALVARQDVRGALRHLNGLTSFRFSALYRFDGDQLRNRCFFDRMNPEVLRTEDIPIEASYCIYVRQSQGPFLLADSLRDERVRGHRKQPEVRSYCGVPLVDPQGWMLGSVCHFDFEPHPFQEGDVVLLDTLAQLLVQHEQPAPGARA